MSLVNTLIAYNNSINNWNCQFSKWWWLYFSKRCAISSEKNIARVSGISNWPITNLNFAEYMGSGGVHRKFVLDSTKLVNNSRAILSRYIAFSILVLHRVGDLVCILVFLYLAYMKICIPSADRKQSYTLHESDDDRKRLCLR